MNKVILVGRLCRDPDVKNTTSGRTVATFTLAVDRRFKNKDGQKEADFIPIVFWGKQAELVGQYLSKGSQIGVTGRLQVRSYDTDDGQRRYVTEVVGDELTFLQTKPQSGSNQNLAPPADANNMSAFDDDFHLMEDDEEVPF